MIAVPNENVFVAIAAYREPELELTIRSCIDNASHPERLRFGVCLQYDLDGPPQTQPDCLDGLDAVVRRVRKRPPRAGRTWRSSSVVVREMRPRSRNWCCEIGRAHV